MGNKSAKSSESKYDMNYGLNYSDYRMAETYFPSIKDNYIHLDERVMSETSLYYRSLLLYFIRKKLFEPLKRLPSMITIQGKEDTSQASTTSASRLSKNRSLLQLAQSQSLLSLSSITTNSSAEIIEEMPCYDINDLIVLSWELSQDSNLRKLKKYTKSKIFIQDKITLLDNHVSNPNVEFSLLEDEIFLLTQKLKYAQSMIISMTSQIKAVLSTNVPVLTYEHEKTAFLSFSDNTILDKFNSAAHFDKPMTKLGAIFLDESFILTVDIIRLVLVNQAFVLVEKPYELSNAGINMNILKRMMQAKVNLFVNQTLSSNIINPKHISLYQKRLYKDIWDDINNMMVQLTNQSYICQFKSSQRFSLQRSSTFIARNYLRSLIIIIQLDFIDFLAHNTSLNDWRDLLKKFKLKLDNAINKSTLLYIKDDILLTVSLIKYIECKPPDMIEYLYSDVTNKNIHFIIAQLIGLLKTKIIVGSRKTSPLYSKIVHELEDNHNETRIKVDTTRDKINEMIKDEALMCYITISSTLQCLELIIETGVYILLNLGMKNTIKIGLG